MSFFNSFIDTLKRHFLAGVLVVVPVILTFIVLRFLFETVDGILQSYLHDILGYYRTGLGVLAIIILIFIFGLLSRNYLGHRIYKVGDKILHQVPIIRPIYSAAKQLLEAITTTSSTGSFKEVGLVEYPRKGAFQLCFISRQVVVEKTDNSAELVSVFVPSTPTPISGMIVLVPKEDLTILDMSVEDGIKFLVSGGVASPDTLREKKSLNIA